MRDAHELDSMAEPGALGKSASTKEERTSSARGRGDKPALERATLSKDNTAGIRMEARAPMGSAFAAEARAIIMNSDGE